LRGDSLDAKTKILIFEKEFQKCNNSLSKEIKCNFAEYAGSGQKSRFLRSHFRKLLLLFVTGTKTGSIFLKTQQIFLIFR
jgi:hypothetical protein